MLAFVSVGLKSIISLDNVILQFAPLCVLCVCHDVYFKLKVLVSKVTDTFAN